MFIREDYVSPGVQQKIDELKQYTDDMLHLKQDKEDINISLAQRPEQKSVVGAINDIGTDKSAEFLRNVGITPISEGQINMTMALGSIEASPLQMAAAYSAIANDGVYIEPTFYTKVVDSNGNVILQKNQESRTVMSSATAYIIKEILTEGVRSGAGGYAAISGISVGGKTGTSNDDYDRWFCGFTPYYTCAVWGGYDDNKECDYDTSFRFRLWKGIMSRIHENLERKDFKVPTSVEKKSICTITGKLATNGCPSITEYFAKDTLPSETCSGHGYSSGRKYKSSTEDNDTTKDASSYSTNTGNSYNNNTGTTSDNTGGNTGGSTGGNTGGSTD